jgi:CBS domain-containing protein
MRDVLITRRNVHAAVDWNGDGIMRVADLMTKQVQSCGPDDSLERAARFMWDHDCGCLPVCTIDGNGANRTVGMITDRDICMSALFQRRALRELRVRDAMARQVLTCHAGDPLAGAEKVMRGGQIRRLPVVDDEGSLIGIISLADLAREAARERSRARKNVTETQVGHTLALVCAPATQSKPLVNASDPTKPDELEELRSRMAVSAAYFHRFDAVSVPFRIPAGMVCSNFTDENTGTEYISLANGKSDAASNGPTAGYSIRLPDTLEAAASGRSVSVNIVARAADGAQSRFALAYSTNEVGNSGWRWLDAGPGWSLFTMKFKVPVMKNGRGDFVGILPDTEGRPGTEFCYLSIEVY